ncbi:hypothetical protein GFV14_00774 [Candidatus Hartigia pinicola]|nr:hypothetical protein GFV14_00774 [Candidatus Hartigia pinicola]
MYEKKIVILFFLMLSLSLSNCGLKGPLYYIPGDKTISFKC